MSGSLLYYPSINIHDSAWLRNAILYWDNVSSIVPNEYEPECSPEIEYLRNEGFYIPSYPSRLFHSEKYEDFEAEVIKKLTPFKKVRLREDGAFIQKTKLNWPELSFQIHCRKLYSGLYDFMLEHRLIESRGDEWLEMESRAATIYMSTMAGYLAAIHQTPMVVGTDRNIFLRNAFHRTLPSEKNYYDYSCAA